MVFVVLYVELVCCVCVDRVCEEDVSQQAATDVAASVRGKHPRVAAQS